MQEERQNEGNIKGQTIKTEWVKYTEKNEAMELEKKRKSNSGDRMMGEREIKKIERELKEKKKKW